MNLENLIYKRLSEAKDLTKHLTTFGGKPAVFTPEAPGDRAVGWGATTQYPRIVFNFDMQTDGERKSAGTLLVSLICRNDSDAVPELIEPAVRECLKDVLLKDDSNTLYAFAWARTDGFSMTEEKNELLIGSEIRFDIIEYPCQETTGPDPIVAMARYIKGMYPDSIVVGIDHMDDETEASKISIHALREEGDSKNGEKHLRFCFIIKRSAQIWKSLSKNIRKNSCDLHRTA